MEGQSIPDAAAPFHTAATFTHREINILAMSIEGHADILWAATEASDADDLQALADAARKIGIADQADRIDRRVAQLRGELNDR